MSVRPAFIALYCMTGKHGLHMQARKSARIVFICGVSTRRLLQIRWQDKVTNSEILKCAVARLDLCRNPKDLLYAELAEGVRPMGRPCLRFKDICKGDVKLADADINVWECVADDRKVRSVMVRGGIHKAKRQGAIWQTGEPGGRR